MARRTTSRPAAPAPEVKEVTVTAEQTPAEPVAPVETPAEPGTEVQTSPVEQDVTPAPAEESNAVPVPAGDPRESALAALVFGKSTPAEVVTGEAELVVDESEVIDFGGRSKAVVIVSYYNQFVDGLVKQAKKGQVIKTDAESLARGVRIKALRKLGD